MKCNHIIKISVLSILTFAFLSCSSQENEKQERQKEIDSYTKAINSNPILLDQKKADTILTLYKNYINDYPQDTMSEFYLFQMYNIYTNLNDCDSAIHCLDRIIKEYPNGKKVGAAYFFKGVALNDVCLNKEASIKAFEEYIRRYPNNPNVKTAKRMMQIDTMQNPINFIKNNEDTIDK